MLFGIQVIVIAPGSVATAIWDKAETADISPFEKTPYRSPLVRFGDIMLEWGCKELKPEVPIDRQQQGHIFERRPRPRMTPATPTAPQTPERSVHPRSLDSGRSMVVAGVK
jgi:NAD(P)-dependent dehydrogenase (short-subunit alcohol dehydrogenase family)